MSGSGQSGPLLPTFHGFVQTSMDGLMLFEACLSGKLHHVPRRPHDRERANLIKSGSVFIYEENASGIKRWTDGVAWSPSRILGNFLIYRELEKPFPPGEKKRAMKRKRSSQINEDGLSRRDSDDQDASQTDIPATPPTPKLGQEMEGGTAAESSERELDRQLIGSLVDSYGFRSDGLVKKTMSITVHGVSHHLVSYYKVEDVKANRLPRPSEDGRLHGMTVRPDLFLKQNFRTPVEETEHYVIDPNTYRARPGSVPYPAYAMPQGYAPRPGGYAPPAPPPGYQLQAHHMYAQPLPHGGQWPQQQHMPQSPYGQPQYSHPQAQQMSPTGHMQQHSQAQQSYADYYSRPQQQGNVPAPMMQQGYETKYQPPPGQ